MPRAFLNDYQALANRPVQSIGSVWLILACLFATAGCSSSMVSGLGDGSADQQGSTFSDTDGLIQVNTTVNTYGLLAEDAVFGATQIELAPGTPAAAMGLSANDLLLIMQMQ